MRAEQERSKYRHERVERMLLEEVRSLLRDEVRDPLLAVVRVEGLKLSVDHRAARVEFVLTAAEGEDRPDRGAVERALERASRFLRSMIAADLDLKRTPELSFVCHGYVIREELGLPA